MLYTESVLSRHAMMSTMMQSVQAAKPRISITLKGEGDGVDSHHNGRMNEKYFTTREQIEGEVSFTAPSDTRFDEICIDFEGM